MKIDVYAICWNEADMLGFFFKNYDGLASRYIIYDDGSTDGSLDILRNHPKVELRRFNHTFPDSFVLSALQLQNTIWRESRWTSDWVIITAIDEHLIHPNLCGYLRQCLRYGVTIIPALGYQMISDRFPEPDETLSKSVARGAPFDEMNKLCIFQPKALRQTNYAVGRHTADPEGDVVLPARDEVLNLHYKYLDFDRVFERHKMLQTGLGSKDKEYNWGHRYSWGVGELTEEWEQFNSAALDLRELDTEALARNCQPTWWRDRRPAYAAREVKSTSGFILYELTKPVRRLASAFVSSGKNGSRKP